MGIMEKMETTRVYRDSIGFILVYYKSLEFCIWKALLLEKGVLIVWSCIYNRNRLLALNRTELSFPTTSLW